MKKQIILKCAAVSVVAFCLCGCSRSAPAMYKSEAAFGDMEVTVIMSEQESKDEALYVKAVEEEKSMHYTYAKEIFLQIMDYKDSKAHYDSLLKTLKPYNGSYSIDANDGGSYTITINDGIGTMSRDNLSGSIHTLNLYGMYFRDVSDEVCIVFDVNLGKEDWNYAGPRDIYVLELDEDGKVNVHGIDGNKNHEWDGSGVKSQ